MPKIPEKVLEALKHVQQHHPTVVQVFYGVDQRWQYMTADFEAPKFGPEIDVSLLEDAADKVDYLPAAFADPSYTHVE